MPLLSRLFIKVAFLYLVVGLVLGVGIAAARYGGGPWWALALGPAWIHVLVVGWLTQLIFGVAFWLFPRYSRDRPFGAEGLAWVAFFLLNAGLVARTIAEPVAGGQSSGSIVLVGSAVGQALGVLAYTVYIWPRVRVK
jgi:hypothetical protein